MSLKIIHPSFEIDLSSTDINLSEENPWYNSEFFFSFSYPITITLTPELDKAMGGISGYNTRGVQTFFDVIFENEGSLEEAILEVREVIEDEITFEFRHGLGDFPLFDRKLATFNFPVFVIPQENMYLHAASIINQSYPQVNYNFPQLITDAFDDREDFQYGAFEGKINNYREGAFVENSFNVEKDENQNLNIMQPMPYLLAVLEQGCQEAGLELGGDILTDTAFAKATINTLSEYYSSINQRADTLVVRSDEHAPIVFDQNGFAPIYAFYSKDYIFIATGRYLITGTIAIKTKFNEVGYVKIYIGGVLVYNNTKFSTDYRERIETIEIRTTITGGSNILIESLQWPRQEFGDEIVLDAIIADLSIIQIGAFDANGELTSALVIPEVIDLSRCVPDITFGTLIETLARWKNLDLTIIDGVLRLDYIRDKIIPQNVKDLSNFQERRPRRIMNSGRSWLLTMGAPRHDDVSFDPIYFDSNGTANNEDNVTNDTERIEIKAVPLPLKFQDNADTAYLYFDDKEVLALSRYDGLTGGLNIAQSINELKVPSVFENYYQSWWNFRLQTVTFAWDFLIERKNTQNLNSRSWVYAYNNIMLVKSIVRNLRRRDLWEYTIEADVLE